MTYNFDPDRWYETQRALLDARKRDGELDDRGFEAALEDLDRRYEEMLDRLDGSFKLPS
jgi:hypothetical protein